VLGKDLSEGLLEEGYIARAPELMEARTAFVIAFPRTFSAESPF
jgi:hypothetical protein